MNGTQRALLIVMAISAATLVLTTAAVNCKPMSNMERCRAMCDPRMVKRYVINDGVCECDAARADGRKDGGT